MPHPLVAAIIGKVAVKRRDFCGKLLGILLEESGHALSAAKIEEMEIVEVVEMDFFSGIGAQAAAAFIGKGHGQMRWR